MRYSKLNIENDLNSKETMLPKQKKKSFTSSNAVEKEVSCIQLQALQVSILVVQKTG